MKIQDIIDAVDTTGNRNTDWVDWDRFSEILGIWNDSYDQEKFEKRLTARFYATWLCTDTHVGGRVYYLDGEPVAVSWQPGRKWPEEIKFLSLNAVAAVKRCMLDCCLDTGPDMSGLLVDMDEDKGDGYKLMYGGQALRKDCLHEPSGRSCEITETFNRLDDIAKWTTAVVRFEDGGVESVPMNELLFSYGR